MKIIYIYGNMTHYDHGLGAVITRTQDVFSELDAQTETIDLGVLHPPHYDGETTNAIDGIMEKIKSANGIILACTAQNFAPTAFMQIFLEYLEHEEYSQVLSEKHVMIITVANKSGEKSACDYLARVVHFYGGYVVTSIGLSAQNLNEISDEFVDKTAEDFYRAVHQKRKYIIPTDFSRETQVQTVEKPKKAKIVETTPIGFTDTQEKEIDELSFLFTKMHSKGEASATVNESFLVKSPVLSKGRNGTVKSLTERLPEFFNSQLSSGLQAVIQLVISGSETFDGAIRIHSTECTYTDGSVPAPDIIILADAAVWHDVLTNKNTAQKAFMTGGIKVRGDFGLLSKFDTLFTFTE